MISFDVEAFNVYCFWFVLHDYGVVMMMIGGNSLVELKILFSSKKISGDACS